MCIINDEDKSVTFMVYDIVHIKTNIFDLVLMCKCLEVNMIKNKLV